MNLLEIMQTLHREAKLPGSPPSAVEGLSGRAADVLHWSIEGWNDIQREKEGKWKWMRKPFTLDTVAGTISYAFGDCTDVEDDDAISRFRSWDIDPCESPLIHLVSEGEDSQRDLVITEWPRFRHMYVRGTHLSDYPTYLSVDASDRLYLGPKPDGIYRVSGNYWRGNQTLVLADDVPEMPVDFHMLVVYRAIVKYAYNVVGHEILARARAEGTPILDALVGNQHYGMFTIRTAGALA